MGLFDEKPPVVRSAETLSTLFSRYDALHHVVEVGRRKLLDDAHAAGKLLLAIRERCQADGLPWLDTLEKFRPGQLRTAQRYLRITRNWHKVRQCENMMEALQALADAEREDDDDAPPTPAGDRTGVPPAKTPEPTPHPSRTSEHQATALSSEVGENEAPEPPAPHPDTLADWLPRVRQLRSRLAAVQQELSVMLAEQAVRPAIEQAASLSSQLRLFRTGGLVSFGRFESGEQLGPPEYTCDALQTLLLMAGRLVAAVEREVPP